MFSCQARERQEDLAMDMKILQKVIEDSKNEEMEDKSRKVCFSVCIAIALRCRL